MPAFQQSYLKSKRSAWTIALLGALLLVSCHRLQPMSSGHLPQRGYLWQRDWTPAVNTALAEAQRGKLGVVVLGAEIEWTKMRPNIVRATVDWEKVKDVHASFSIALRVAPFAGPSGQSDPALRSIAEVAQSLLAEAHA